MLQPGLLVWHVGFGKTASPPGSPRVALAGALDGNVRISANLAIGLEKAGVGTAGRGEVAVEEVTGSRAVLGRDRGPDPLGASDPAQAQGPHGPVDRPG